MAALDRQAPRAACTVLYAFGMRMPAAIREKPFCALGAVPVRGFETFRAFGMRMPAAIRDREGSPR
jgi:hypothetical protein